MSQDVELKPGQIVNDYKVTGRLGAGAFGTVYAAEHPLIGKRAAIKVLKPVFAANEEMMSRFMAEARVVNQIRHRHIIDIFAFGKLDSGSQYFVMELLEGMPFDEYLHKHGALAPEVALPILEGVARALEAAHKVGVAHRDLKPANVFLSFDDDGIFPKLLDFGIAKLLGDASAAHHTRAGTPMGTPLYMSPEQCRGGQIDHRTDIYAFGVMTHEALAGRRPFKGGSAMEAMMQQMGEAPAPLSSHRSDLPPLLDRAILAMLAKDPEQRPSSILTAFESVAQVLRGGVGGGARQSAVPHSSVASPAVAAADPAMDTAAFLASQQGGAAASQLAAGHSGAHSLAAQSGAGVSHVPAMQTGAGASQVPAAQSGAGVSHIPATQTGAGVSQVPVSAAQPASSTMAAQPYHAPAASPPRTQAMSAVPMTQPSAGMGTDARTSHAPGSGGMTHPSAGMGGVSRTSHAPGSGGMTHPSVAMGAGGSASASMTGMDAALSTPMPVATAQRKSPLPLVFGAIGAVMVLLVGAFLMFSGGEVQPDETRAGGPQPVDSAEPAEPEDKAIRVAAAAPAPGTAYRLDRAYTSRMSIAQMDGPEAAKMHIDDRRRVDVSVTKSEGAEVTEIKLTYLEHQSTTDAGKPPVKNEKKPTAGRTFIVKWSDADDHELLVSSPSGRVTPEQQSLVLDDAETFMGARADFLDKPLKIGEPISVDHDQLVVLMALDEADEGTSEKLSASVLKLTRVREIEGRQVGEFDVSTVYIAEGDVPGAGHLHVESPLVGSLKLDLASGWLMSMDMGGPFRGTLTNKQTALKVGGKLSSTAKLHH